MWLVFYFLSSQFLLYSIKEVEILPLSHLSLYSGVIWDDYKTINVKVLNKKESCFVRDCSFVSKLKNPKKLRYDLLNFVLREDSFKKSYFERIVLVFKRHVEPPFRLEFYSSKLDLELYAKNGEVKERTLLFTAMIKE